MKPAPPVIRIVFGWVKIDLEGLRGRPQELFPNPAKGHRIGHPYQPIVNPQEDGELILGDLTIDGTAMTSRLK